MLKAYLEDVTMLTNVCPLHIVATGRGVDLLSINSIRAEKINMVCLVVIARR